MKNIKGYYINRWILDNPYIIWRTAKGFFRALFNKYTLRSIEIFPSMQCNLKCHMCSVEKFKLKAGAELTLDDYSRIAHEGAVLGATSLTVLGGEPLLVDKLEDIISVFKKKKYYKTFNGNNCHCCRNYDKWCSYCIYWLVDKE